MRKAPMPIAHEPETPESRDKVKSAFDPDHDPTCYGMNADPASDRQAVYGGNSFAQMRDDMNRRREQTARRMTDRRRY